MELARTVIFVFIPLLFVNRADSSCPSSFECGDLGTLEFPLSNRRDCGLFMVENCTALYPVVHFGAADDGHPYTIMKRLSANRFLINDELMMLHLRTSVCLGLRNLSLPVSPLASFSVTPIMTAFLCSNQLSYEPNFEHYHSTNCSPLQVYYRYPSDHVPDNVPSDCSVIQVPVGSGRNSDNLTDVISSEYVVEWNVSEDCYECHHGGGKCLTNHMNQFHCDRGDNRRRKVVIGVASGGGVLLIMSFAVASYVLWQRKKKMNNDYLLSRSLSFDPSSKSDVEGGGSFYFGIPIFSYAELEEATSNFDPSKELGDGGFGTVYHGKLRDGREVAIKRLYEHNYRRVEQFMNEIKILTALRHQNLVSLYGCTSRRSRELLLVYEYIPNGTVADHLHGKKQKQAHLPWPVRLRIALETATALAYLHKSDIIHRDVKTNNILLDASFRVKVADFGLSRLFPNDVTHVSTAPQGTPGYVDPDYHQCYHLTDKSDVYSFGVVLIELISSMPAVDITRHRHEINLANLALNRIQRCEFADLIDPALGYGTDAEVARMTTAVAELAFRCLQPDKDLRPPMDEVVEFLRDVAGNLGKVPQSPETDESVLLKDKDLQASSPKTVTDTWASSSSTTSSSVS